MKSFGVRLGAGAITIVLAAYLMMNSQQSEPEDVSSWTAGNGSSQAPADPLSMAGDADSLGSDWLEQPETDLLSANRELVGESADVATPPAGTAVSANGEVRLVQHDETDDSGAVTTAFGGSLPSTLSASSVGADTITSSQGVASDQAWLLPSGESVQDETTPAVDTAGELTFPGPEQSDELSVPSPETILAVPSLPQAEPAMIPATTEGLVPDGSPAVGFGVPGESLQSGAVDVAVLGETDVASTGQPENFLRGGFGGENILRGSEQPADLGYSFDEPTVTASSSTTMTQVGSGMANATQADTAEFSLSNETRLPGIQDLEQQPVGNGLRNPSPSDVASANVGDSSDSTSAFSTEQNVVRESSEVGSSNPVMGLPGRLGGVEDFASTNPIREQTPIEGAASSVLEVAPTAPSLAAAGNPLVYGVDSFGGTATDAGLSGANPSGVATSDPVAITNRSAAVATKDSPGERRLEGAQTPSVVIQKRAPTEVRVGKAASFVVNVQNVGVADALNVEVYDRIPAGMRFVEASPAAQQFGNQLMWELGSMAAGEERTITMQLVPEQEGELGSVARVSFEAAASVRTLSTKPELKIVQRVPEQGVLIGQQLEIEIEVSNPGSGSANGVVLQEDVPEGLEHPRGRQLDNALGTLAPGEVRRQVLRLRAVRPGVVENTIRLVSDDGLETEHSVAVQVVAPDLQVQLNGPSRRFLERPATYELLVANQGTADATNLEIAVHLDRGFTFVSTENEGYYDPNRHAVFWSLANLPAGAQGIVPLTLLPVEIGEQAIRIEADGDLGVAVQSQRAMTVEGFAELSFAVSNPGGPIEIGAETEYEVIVTNTGSMADANVRIQLQLPVGLELVSTSGDAGTDGQGLIAFQPIASLQPNQIVKQTIRVRGLNAGVHLVKAVVVSDQSAVPVTKEESTRVYADQ